MFIEPRKTLFPQNWSGAAMQGIVMTLVAVLLWKSNPFQEALWQFRLRIRNLDSQYSPFRIEIEANLPFHFPQVARMGPRHITWCALIHEIDVDRVDFRVIGSPHGALPAEASRAKGPRIPKYRETRRCRSTRPSCSKTSWQPARSSGTVRSRA